MLGGARPVAAQLEPDPRAASGTTSSELNAFFANSAAATKATSSGRTPSAVHYLRTINPINPENLAAYPRRIGTQPHQPVPAAGSASPAKLRQGLDSYETRQCGRSNPSLAPDDDRPGAISPADAAAGAGG